MPHEIADSDAESDLDSPGRQPILGETMTEHGGTAASSQINFDEYMDPTQRLSSLESAERTSANTIGLFDGISEAHDALIPNAAHGQRPDSADPPPVARSRKRAHSAMYKSPDIADYDVSVKLSTTKRTKTYSHRSKSGAAEHQDLFATSPELLFQAENKASVGQSDDSNTREAAPSFSDQSTSLAVSHLNGVDRPRQISIHNSLQNITTSTASMGGYASINLDYRGSGEAIDINANPFGSLSQVSLDEDSNPTETERVANVFRQNQKASENDRVVKAPAFIDPSRLAYDDLEPSEAYLNGNEEDKFTPADPMPAPDKTSIAEDQVLPKKHGRRPKNSRMLSESPAPAVPDKAMDEHDLPDPELIRRSRQGTSKQVAEADAALAEQSPVKQPTNEVNLSDEQFVGLPKESYKPRPSRSRSKKLPSEDDVYSPPRFANIATDSPAKSKPLSNSTSPRDQEAGAPVEISTTKKGGRKSRVKRAKTSGAALKITEPMLSEGEDDVLWMDSKPAPVKIELPPDLKVLKGEEGQKSVAEAELEAEHNVPNGTTSNITIELPMAANRSYTASSSKAPPVVAAPKKRGRKSKKIQEELRAEPEAVVVDELEGEEPPNDNTRQPLSEKPGNITALKARSTTPKAPTVSPLSSPDTKPRTTTSPTKETQTGLPPDPINLTTPTKATIEKGPTKHSPINPPSLPGSSHSNGKKTLYRIGLSRRQNIPSLLRRVQRDKPAPKIVVAKEKEKKKKNAGDNGSDDDDDNNRLEIRGADGMLVEWGD
ncbi:uncharacterized protein A1O9_08421 [Exophiala aquamarina CBS 119918]|uniref:Uncharacterized protein n=1 Tax=Exophiala aquamarina CBS 119918 TaxID=1182545 RepID=A0A072P754_9EURO|nr:uncharacterized protein A1O9_08421 [Exophiala aquamarina CBS 119918]KEF55671.1 hypothetical protein A1O9_08421 [Exophiala aquamarina CBS 119918]